MIVDESSIESVLCAIKDAPGISASRIAKDMGWSLVESLRILSLLATADGMAPGPALIRLETRSATSLSARATLTEAGEALWIL